MFWTRVASGVLLAPLFLALVYGGSPYFDVLMALTAGLMAWEFTRMDGAADKTRRILTSTAAVAAVTVMALGSFVGALGVIALATVAAVAADRTARPGRHMVQLAVAYVALPAISLLYVQGQGGSESIFWILAVVWATDIGAYVCGRLIGGPKLAPAVSPKKTWSGAVGGLVWAVVASGGLYWAYHHSIAPFVGLAAMLLSVISQGGDLFESALKRRYQVKDSGAIIPGHGGVMDRFDGLWAAAPVAALFCVILGGGVQHW